MRALIVGDHESLNARVREVVLRSGVGYGVVDVVPFASVPVGAGCVHYELTVVVLPSDPASGLEALRDIRNVSKSILLAVGPANDAKLVLRALRQGVSEYVDQDDLEAELEASLVRLRVKQNARASNGRIIGLLAASGGSGSSTLAANLAVLLARWHAQSALIDLRLAAADQAVLLDLKPTHTLADLCRNVNRMDRNMFQQSLVRHTSGVHLLAAPPAFDDIAAVTPQGVRQVLALARTVFPYVVLDLDRPVRPEQLAAVLQADLLLLVLRLDLASLRNARRTLDYLKEVGVAEERIRGVANRYGQPKELPSRKVEQALGVTILHYVPNDPARMNLAANKGVPVVLERPRARISKSLVKLAAQVNALQEPYRHNGHGTPDYGMAVADPAQSAAPPAESKKEHVHSDF